LRRRNAYVMGHVFTVMAARKPANSAVIWSLKRGHPPAWRPGEKQICVVLIFKTVTGRVQDGEFHTWGGRTVSYDVLEHDLFNRRRQRSFMANHLVENVVMKFRTNSKEARTLHRAVIVPLGPLGRCATAVAVLRAVTANSIAIRSFAWAIR